MPDVVAFVDPEGAETILTAQAQLKAIRGRSGFYMPPVRWVDEMVPEQHGTSLRQVTYGPREAFFPLLVLGTTETALRTRIRTLLPTLDPTAGDGKLRVTAPDASIRELNCRYIGGMELEEQHPEAGWQRAGLLFRAFDPFWYDQTDTTQTYYGPINLLTKNQSDIAVDTTGWEAVTSATITRTTAKLWQGTASVQVDFAAISGSGMRTTAAGRPAVTEGETYTFSGYFKGDVGGEFIRIQIRDAADTSFLAETSMTLTTTWQRYEVTATIPPGQTLAYLRAQRAGSAPAGTFYADGLQFEKNSEATTFQVGIAPFFPFFPLDLNASTLRARVYPGAGIPAVNPVITNTGDVEAWPVWTIRGPGRDVSLSNTTTGETLNMTVTLEEGDEVTIDTRPGYKSVDLGGANIYYSLDLASGSSLWPLATGPNDLDIRMGDVSAESSIELAYKRRFLGA